SYGSAYYPPIPCDGECCNRTTEVCLDRDSPLSDDRICCAKGERVDEDDPTSAWEEYSPGPIGCGGACCNGHCVTTDRAANSKTCCPHDQIACPGDLGDACCGENLVCAGQFDS